MKEKGKEKVDVEIEKLKIHEWSKDCSLSEK